MPRLLSNFFRQLKFFPVFYHFFFLFFFFPFNFPRFILVFFSLTIQPIEIVVFLLPLVPLRLIELLFFIFVIRLRLVSRARRPSSVDWNILQVESRFDVPSSPRRSGLILLHLIQITEAPLEHALVAFGSISPALIFE